MKNSKKIVALVLAMVMIFTKLGSLLERRLRNSDH